MRFRIGQHVRADGEVEVSIVKRSVETEAGTPWATEETWSLNGMIVSQSGSYSDIKAKTTQLEAAFSYFLDVALLMPDGSPSHHQILNANTVGGIRVVQPPQYQDGKGPQGVTYRNWQAQISAIVPLPVGQLVTALKVFRETITRSGGGIRRSGTETLVGLPRFQTLRQRTIYKAIQQGSAVGIYQRPNIPPPIWPAMRTEENPVVTLGEPRRVNNEYIEWPISWQYDFESPVPLLGQPHIWGVTY